VIAFWIGLPLELRFMILAGLGLIGGALANHIVYTFAFFNPRPISPWGPTPDGVPPRNWTDRIPVFGWLGLRRESTVHGRLFWIRPMLIELSTAFLFMWLYWFETQHGGLYPADLRTPRNLNLFAAQAVQMFFAHALLAVFLIAATFIDFDELTIPDVITIPGTLIGLVIASITMNHFLPTDVSALTPGQPFAPTTFDSPWFAVPNRWSGTTGLWTALAIWTGWCFALVDRRWSSVIVRRRGIGRAIRHFINGVFHYGFWKVLAVIWIVGIPAIVYVWNLGDSNWKGLFTALVGLAVGGGVIWAIRIVATLALDKEAMGFGDVTLMAMIGTFIGWQASLIAFFLSPFTAIFIVLARYLVTRDTYTPYGPYLCAGTALTIVYWDGLYNGWLAPNLGLMGNMLLWLCLALLGLMAVMLFFWRLIKGAFA
jgi:prepilin signal peptidase PulO-like enzyme (type II secretory pathway)